MKSTYTATRNKMTKPQYGHFMKILMDEDFVFPGGIREDKKNFLVF